MDDGLLPTKIVLIDRNPKLVEAWKQAFAVFPEVEPLTGDYFQRPADAISQANSFGIMDGGQPFAIRDHLGYAVQSKLHKSARRINLTCLCSPRGIALTS